MKLPASLPPGYKPLMQLELTFGSVRPAPPQAREEWLRLGERTVALWLVPNLRARRYVLRLTAEGVVRVTVPGGGSRLEARRFVQRNQPWLEHQFKRQALPDSRSKEWTLGSSILFRGNRVRLERAPDTGADHVRFADQSFCSKDLAGDLRPAVERSLWGLAVVELPRRVLEIAAHHQFPVTRVIVRNQRSRWGSCSKRGSISLNWRLIQMPDFVRDYVILHELAHLKHMNHSARFWKTVAQLCPDLEQAEAWLKQNSELLR